MNTTVWEGKSILIVEDDEISLEFLKELFEPYKVRIFTAYNGREALELCKKESSISLVLMDVQLPLMNGKDAMKEIKKMRPDLPVIAQTAFAMSGDKERYLNDGFDNYISKPINVQELITIVESFFN
jgi:CheY-like chemotaxis protein